MFKARKPPVLAHVSHWLLVATGATSMTTGFFMVLPVIQAITAPPEAEFEVRDLDVGNVPPPVAPPEEAPEPEPEPEPEPPKLAEDTAPLDLAQLELALNPTIGDGWLGGDFAMKLTSAAASGADVDALFSLADLDQEPRRQHTPPPTMTAQIRKKAPGTVYVLFTVDQRGRVENPIVQRSTDPVFEKAALAAVKQWRFEPGKRNGQPVKFRMRIPITFPKQS